MPRGKKAESKKQPKSKATNAVAAVASPTRSTQPMLPTPWKLFTQSLQDYRANWRLIVTIMLIVALPVAIFSNFGLNPSGDSTLSAYLAFAQFCMNVALVYAVIKLVHGETTTAREAYYKGSAMLVRLVLVTILLFCMAIFLLVGAAILGYGVIAPGTQLTTVEQALLVLLAIAVAVPSVILLTRGLFAIYVVFETEQGPIQAVRASRRLVKGRVLATLGRLAALIGFLILLLIIPMVVLVSLQQLTQWVLFAIILQAVTSLIVLPVMNFYLYRYYQGLK